MGMGQEDRKGKIRERGERERRERDGKAGGAGG